jgi:hypothetical protein
MAFRLSGEMSRLPPDCTTSLRAMSWAVVITPSEPATKRVGSVAGIDMP